MYSQVSNFPASTLKVNDIIPDTKRSIANFHPSIWKDHFLSLTFDDELKVDNATKGVEKLKEEIRMMVIDSMGNPLEKLKLVDSIQRLGVSYHFEDEIQRFLEHLYVSYNSILLTNNDNNDDEDLHITALLFRLLRQQGYTISCDIFLKFVDKNGKFRESLGEDERGILSLYEASHMRGHGEVLLEEALEFTITHLKTYIHQYSDINPNNFGAEVRNALKLPIRKGVSRIKAREYLEVYQQHPFHNKTLLTFSKIDFNILQKLHQKELTEICRWWKDLNVPTNFPFARDRIVECYFWILSIYFEPHFKFGRKILTKVIAMISIMDDIYDAYGTFEELQVFTLAIKRWDMSMVNLLPEYMKVYYTNLLDLFEEIGKEIVNDGTSYRLHFAKEAMKRQAESYFKEAEWLNKNYKPKYEEYMELGLASSGHELLSTMLFVCMGDLATKEVFDWLSDCPKILKASNTICRLMDDVVSYKFEKEREHVVSAVECYMNNYGCSEEETCAKLFEQVEVAWKTINECCLHPMTVPMPFLICVLNLTRVIALLYSDGDGYTNSKGRTKFLVQSLLIDQLHL